MAVKKAVQETDTLVSEATLNELADVLARPKFDPYVTLQERQEFIRLLGTDRGNGADCLSAIHECRDPKDNKFLEVAVNGEAEMIITGDEDLLVLDPFREIRIVTSAMFLEMGKE